MRGKPHASATIFQRRLGRDRQTNIGSSSSSNRSRGRAMAQRDGLSSCSGCFLDMGWGLPDQSRYNQVNME